MKDGIQKQHHGRIAFYQLASNKIKTCEEQKNYAIKSNGCSMSSNVKESSGGPQMPTMSAHEDCKKILTTKTKQQKKKKKKNKQAEDKKRRRAEETNKVKTRSTEPTNERDTWRRKPTNKASHQRSLLESVTNVDLVAATCQTT